MSVSGQRRYLLAGTVAAVLAGVLVAVVLVATGAFRTSGQVPGTDSADAGFARDMAVHHQQAVEMSFIVRDRTDDEEVRRLAFDIINTQANQRGMLLGRLDVWGLPKVSRGPAMAWMGHGNGHEGGDDGGRDGALMPGMATDRELDELRAAEDEAAEVLYLRLMSEHHRAGVEMAEAAAGKVRDPVMERLARGMVEGQQSEIGLMTDMLTERGADAAG